MLLVLHQPLMPFNLLKYQCFMEASHVFFALAHFGGWGN